MTEYQPLIAIFLGTYNGSRFIQEQLNSLKNQSHSNWCLYVSDDGSSDDTLDIVSKFIESVPNTIKILKGEQKGFCRNFLSMAENPNIKADYYAFCDQDDIWLPQKLAVSLKAIKPFDNQPCSYFSSTIAIDEVGVEFGLSQPRPKPPGFRNAIIQSIAGANTTLFNQKAKELFEKTPNTIHASHDWWLYQLVTGAGGKIIYTETSHILYRFHENNVIGPKIGNKWILNRISRVFASQFKDFNDKNIRALAKYSHVLNKENQEVLEKFIIARKASFFKRIWLFSQLKLYRHSFVNLLAFWVIILLNKA